MKFTIAQRLVEKYPTVNVGLVFLKGCDNRIYKPEVDYILRESESLLRKRLEEKDILDLPEIKLWRETYKSFGAKKGRRVSIEAMAKRVKKGDALPQISPLVDLYNAVSLRYVLPCGGEDLDTLQGDVQLDFADGTEVFYKIGSDENEPPQPGEVVYKDQAGCLCRCWNWREADRTKLTASTQNAVLVVETLELERQEELLQALSHLEDLAKVLTGAETEIHILNASSPSTEY